MAGKTQMNKTEALELQLDAATESNLTNLLVHRMSPQLNTQQLGRIVRYQFLSWERHLF